MIWYFQSRKGDKWVFEESPMRGDIIKDIEVVIKTVSEYLRMQKQDDRIQGETSV